MIAGRRERVVISCVTFETVKISDPIRLYEATKVHLIHYIENPDSEKGKVYQKFYDRVCELTREYSKNILIIEHNAVVTDFKIMLKTAHNIINEEYKNDPHSDIFINISAGTSEYAAAAAIASMMFSNTIPFSVSTDEFQVKDLSIYCDDNNNLVGLTKKIKDLKIIPKYSVDSPNKNLVLGLKIFDSFDKIEKSPKGPEMIQLLKNNKLWYRGSFSEESQKRSEAVYYYRDFVKSWMLEEWIYKDKHTKKYHLTDKGKTVLNTFYCDDKLLL